MKYVYFYPMLNITEYKFGVNTTLCLNVVNENLIMKTGKQGKINEIGKEILLLFDGTNTLNDIILNLCSKYNEEYAVVETKVNSFLNIVDKQYGYRIKTQALPLKHNINCTKYENMYPAAASVELTNRCNIRCRHCYGCFGEAPVMKSMNLNEIEKIIQDLVDIGVNVLELTGGDPTVNQYCKDAVRIACEKGISRVMLLTNGINLSTDLINVMKKYKDKVYVQVDLHSLDSDFYDWFTNSKGHLDSVKENICKLITNGIRTRTCAIFTPGNLFEIEEIAQWSYEHGAFQFAPSIVTPVGRARREETLDLSFEQLVDFLDKLEMLKQKYPNFIGAVEKNVNSHRKNCGALTSEISINSFGKIKLCTMDSVDYFDLGFRNVFDGTLKEILDENMEFLNALRELELPEIESDECKECEKRAFCHHCLNRGIISSMETGINCKWKEKMDPILKQRIYNRKE